MADVSKLKIGQKTYNISDSTARQTASQASQAATEAQQTASQASQAAINVQNSADNTKTLALQGFSVAFSEPDTITFTQITEE